MTATKSKLGKLRRGAIELELSNRRVSVKALVLLGLAVHKPYEGGGFTVSHTVSGLRVASFSLQRDAKQFLERALDLGIDWTADLDTINRDVLSNELLLKKLIDSIQGPCTSP